MFGGTERLSYIYTLFHPFPLPFPCTDDPVDQPDRKFVIDLEDPKKMLFTKIIMNAFVIVGVIIYFFEVAGGIVDRLEDSHERKDDNTVSYHHHLSHLDPYTGQLGPYDSLISSSPQGYYRRRRPSKRSASPYDSFLSWPLFR